MKFLTLCIFLIALSLAASCSALQRTVITDNSTLQRKLKALPLISEDLSFAKDFVRTLNDAGWIVREVHHSKFNSFFKESSKAAFIRTDKGAIEAIFFESDADVKQIRVSEAQTGDLKYHSYLVQKLPLTNQRIEGGETYFAKYRNVFIITINSELSDDLNQLPR